MSVILSHVWKSYGDNHVLRDLNWTLEDGGIYCLMAPSGSGKTTLFRVMLGLEQADSGTVSGAEPGCVGVMFQEDRLCEGLTPVENVLLLLPKGARRAQVERLLGEVLPDDCLVQPASELSGGMRRRVALARAVAYPSSAIVLDEPFTGLDEATRANAISFILRHRGERALLVATHGADDAEMLGAEILHLDELNGTAGKAAGDLPTKGKEADGHA